MGVIHHHSLGSYLGFHVHGEENSSEEMINHQHSTQTTDVLHWNIPIALNLIPVIGNILAGITHINIGRKKGDSCLIARGIAEVTVVGGLILALVDVIMTLGRIVLVDGIGVTPGCWPYMRKF